MSVLLCGISFVRCRKNGIFHYEKLVCEFNVKMLIRIYNLLKICYIVKTLYNVCRKNDESEAGIQTDETYICEEETYHGLLSDYDFFDYIIQGYEDAASLNQKYFNFSVTYQNHGPYETESDTDETYLFRKDGYTDNEYNILNNYLYYVSKTDKAIAKLRAYIDEQEEPIILVLFGDHNPWLGDNNSVYEMLGINQDLDTEEGAENYYETRYIVYANEAAKEMYGKSFTEEGNTISPMFLMNEIFDYLGLEGPAYLNYLDDLKSQYNILNTVYTGNIGNLQLTADLTDDDAIKEQKQIEYYLKYVKK